jgi:hypothetical protein
MLHLMPRVSRTSPPCQFNRRAGQGAGRGDRAREDKSRPFGARLGIYLRWDTDVFAFRHVQVLTVLADGIARIDSFHAKRLAEDFGLPEELPG